MGFGAERYTVVESTMSLNVTVQLVEGILDTDVDVRISVLKQPGNLAVPGTYMRQSQVENEHFPCYKK